MRLVDRVRSAQAVAADRYLPFSVEGKVVGRVRRDLAEHLHGFAEVFAPHAHAWTFATGLDTPAERSEAMARVAQTLAERGLLTPWRNETYDIVHAFGQPPLFAVERAAVRFFGFDSFAVHINGVVGSAAGQTMWIARRSDQKAIDPGMHDNLVGGGLASGLSVRTTVTKESFEEAGIAPALANTARAAGAIRVAREVPEGLHSQVMFVYDLALRDDFVPVNQDGEVADFRRLAIADVVAEMEAGAAYTADAALVIVHFLVRHGHVSADEAPELVTAPFL
jgi:hypothetical protein